MSCLFIALAVFTLGVVQADEPPPTPWVVRYPDMGSRLDQRNAYFEALLRLALEQTVEEFGPYRLEPVRLQVPQGRLLRLLSTGEQIDVVWSMTTRDRERHLRPVRIPLTKGMVGYRLLIVRQSNAAQFAEIDSLKGLAGKVAGQGGDWPDTDILRHNELSVTTSGYLSLFTMLQHERIDYIPRALNEPWSEVAERPEMGLQVESTLMLHYPAASYFFVPRQNAELAQRLARGLEQAIADGSFDALFFNHPSHRLVFSQNHLSRRRVLTLDNPLLPEQTPFDRQELWWQPGGSGSAGSGQRPEQEASE